MRFGAVLAAAGVFVLLNLTVPDARAQSPAAAPAPAPTDAEPAAPMPTPAELESLLAPIALYPDPLLAQILMAATYPLEVVEADRWLQGPENAALKGDALAQALAREDWDPSVKSLIPFPRILHMMDGELDWTERVGEAFIADQGAVMEAVQRLRSRAQSSGHLATAPQAVVTPEPEAITIEPPSPETVYYPSCDPSLVYGDWLYPAYPAYYFPGYFTGGAAGAFGCGWFVAPVVTYLWGWHHWDWRQRRLGIDRRRYAELNHDIPPIGGDLWEHDPAHRRAVPYAAPATRERFTGNPIVPQIGPAQRGYPTSPASRPYVAPHPPPTFESFGRGAVVRSQAARGGFSRMSAPASAPRIATPSGGGARR